MKEPIEPTKPLILNKYYYCPEFENKELIVKHYIYPECNIEDLEEYWEYEDTGKEMPKSDPWEYDVDFITLDSILEEVGDTDPEQVVISIHRNRDMISLKCKVSIRTPTNKRDFESKKQAENKKYQQDLLNYKEKKCLYDKWKAEKDLKQLEKKLSNLKKKIKNS